ncbi:MAG: M23 family peptidase, partial [Lacrimispora celerecrescens]|nr:M23 family peptidase [Lacrimispora celerecrescens]
MKEKISQLFKDKVFLVLLVLGLLTIVAAAGV